MAQRPQGVSGCPHLPGAREGGAGHRAQAGATAPWRPEPHGTALAMERGPPANGAGVRYSTQLQVRAHLDAGSSQNTCRPLAELPASSSARSGSFEPGGFKVALDPSGRGGFHLTLG